MKLSVLIAQGQGKAEPGSPIGIITIDELLNEAGSFLADGLWDSNDLNASCPAAVGHFFFVRWGAIDPFSPP